MLNAVMAAPPDPLRQYRGWAKLSLCTRSGKEASKSEFIGFYVRPSAIVSLAVERDIDGCTIIQGPSGRQVRVVGTADEIMTALGQGDL